MISKSIIYVSITIIGIAMAGLGPSDNGKYYYFYVVADVSMIPT
jgi:hypothetical protein